MQLPWMYPEANFQAATDALEIVAGGRRAGRRGCAAAAARTPRGARPAWSAPTRTRTALLSH